MKTECCNGSVQRPVKRQKVEQLPKLNRALTFRAKAIHQRVKRLLQVILFFNVTVTAFLLFTSHFQLVCRVSGGLLDAKKVHI